MLYFKNQVGHDFTYNPPVSTVTQMVTVNAKKISGGAWSDFKKLGKRIIMPLYKIQIDLI